MSQTVIQIELSGKEGLVKKLNQIDSNMRGPAAKAMVSAGGSFIQGQARVNIHETFSEKQTGGMSNSITVESKQIGQGAEATISVNKIYARIQEKGGTIRPRKAKMLHFWIDGREVFAHQVTLPPRPYLEPAIKNHNQEIVQAMSDVAETYLRKA